MGAMWVGVWMSGGRGERRAWLAGLLDSWIESWRGGWATGPSCKNPKGSDCAARASTYPPLRRSRRCASVSCRPCPLATGGTSRHPCALRAPVGKGPATRAFVQAPARMSCSRPGVRRPATIPGWSKTTPWRHTMGGKRACLRRQAPGASATIESVQQSRGQPIWKILGFAHLSQPIQNLKFRVCGFLVIGHGCT